ncbi:MAG: Smr/MutS family protein [Flavobacterium sp.]
MIKRFKIGDKVEVVDACIEGKIIKFEKDKCIIMSSDGFEMPFFEKELILKKTFENLKISVDSISKSKTQKDKKLGNLKIEDFTKTKTPYKQQEIDLHIEILLKNYKHLSNYEILTHQINTAKNALNYAIINKIQKIIFIHGVGEGVLRSELEYLFKNYPNTNFQDADYSKYGNGAVEIYFTQKAFS